MLEQGQVNKGIAQSHGNPGFVGDLSGKPAQTDSITWSGAGKPNQGESTGTKNRTDPASEAAFAAEPGTYPQALINGLDRECGTRRPRLLDLFCGAGGAPVESA